MRNVIFIFSLVQILSNNVFSQGCCSGGSGSPIAGGTSQGVLNFRQLEIAGNFQSLSSNKFFTGDKDTVKLFDRLNSNYIYSRFAYGLSKEFTLSVESGYFIDKTLIGLNKSETIKSSGFGDLIIFPRFDLYNHITDSAITEITVGMGLKIPIGKHNDSTVVYTDASGNQFYTTSPPTVQATSGSQDLIFYAFFLRGYPEKKIRVFANCLYVKKGWNSLGQKFGDYSSIGLFGSISFMKRFGLTFQLKGEWTNKMQYDKKVDMLAFYNIDVKSTGGRKLSAVPQLSYTYKNLTTYFLTEIPIYQYLNGTQIGSQYQFTAGISYRYCL
jgi:hypothetical protein